MFMKNITTKDINIFKPKPTLVCCCLPDLSSLSFCNLASSAFSLFKRRLQFKRSLIVDNEVLLVKLTLLKTFIPKGISE